MQYMSKTLMPRFYSQRFRVKIYCFNCDSYYITNVLHHDMLPHRCKNCGSIKIKKINSWSV